MTLDNLASLSLGFPACKEGIGITLLRGPVGRGCIENTQYETWQYVRGPNITAREIEEGTLEEYKPGVCSVHEAGLQGVQETG